MTTPAAESTSTPHSDSGKSESSTIIYDHEPFDQFVVRIRALILQKWPTLADEDITITRMAGGGFNRITGLSFRSKGETEQLSYILRVPRFEASILLNDVAILRFVSKHTDLPIPRVVSFDCTEGNVLGDPYMIQHRIPGTPLIYLFPKLHHKARKQVARQFGHVIRSLTSLRSQRIGRVVVSDGTQSSEDYMVESLVETGAPAVVTPYNGDSTGEDAHQLLLDLFLDRVKIASETPPDIFRLEYFERFCALLSQLNELGYFHNVAISLCHLDLEPRNILFDDSNDPPGCISGVLDWDSALFLPSYMACKPPSWIWGWLEDEDEDEKTANDVPDSAEARELKSVFEHAAGPAYARLAYDPVYRLARRLTQFAAFGIRSSEDCTEADVMLDEWAKMAERL